MAYDISIMKKIVALPLLVLLLPAVGAGFIPSSMTIDVDDPPAIPSDTSVSTTADITFSWGFGAIIPLPVTVKVAVENVPDWVSVSVSPATFTITPSGITGGEQSQSVSITLNALKDVDAYVSYQMSLNASTDGNFLIKGSQASQDFYIMADFRDRGIIVDIPPEVSLYRGEQTQIYLNITNSCNAPIYVEIAEDNTTGFLFSHDEKVSVQPRETKAVPMRIKAEQSAQTDTKITLTYYPVGHEDKSNERVVYLSLESRTKSGGGALAIGLVIVVAAVIAFILWKKTR